MHLHQRNKFSRGSVFFPHLVRGRTIIQHHSVATFYSLDYIWERKENMSYCKVQGVGGLRKGVSTIYFAARNISKFL